MRGADITSLSERPQRPTALCTTSAIHVPGVLVRPRSATVRPRLDPGRPLAWDTPDVFTTPKPLAVTVLAVCAWCVSAAGIAATQAPASPAAQAAQALLQASDWPHAVAAFRTLSVSEPDNPAAWFGLGVSLHESGQYREAIPAFLAAEQHGFAPANQVTYRLARSYARLGDAPKALAALDRLAAAGFVNAPLLQAPDLESLRGTPQFTEVVARVNRNAHPCEFDPEFRRFDFWIGDWDVQQTGAPRAPVGAASRVERILDGCVLLENWTPPGGPDGKSFNIYNTSTRQWEQVPGSTRPDGSRTTSATSGRTGRFTMRPTSSAAARESG